MSPPHAHRVRAGTESPTKFKAPFVHPPGPPRRRRPIGQIEGIWSAKDMESLDRPERRELIKTDREASSPVGRLEAAAPCARAIAEVGKASAQGGLFPPRGAATFRIVRERLQLE